MLSNVEKVKVWYIEMNKWINSVFKCVLEMRIILKDEIFLGMNYVLVKVIYIIIIMCDVY